MGDVALDESLRDAPSARSHWRQVAALLLGDVRGKRLLDFGCGVGGDALHFAQLGARVTGFDSSEVGIAWLKKRAAQLRLALLAIHGRCEATNFAADTFDRVHGHAILHQVGVERGLAEVRRVLRPGGVAVFLEPVREHVTWVELGLGTRAFADARVVPYHVPSRFERVVIRVRK